MSSSNAGSGTTNPSGHGTETGGGDAKTNVQPHPPGPVTNQPLLPLNGAVYANLPPDKVRALSLVQLQFARDVSARAAAAYGEIIEHLQRDC